MPSPSTAQIPVTTGDALGAHRGETTARFVTQPLAQRAADDAPEPRGVGRFEGARGEGTRVEDTRRDYTQRGETQRGETQRGPGWRAMLFPLGALLALVAVYSVFILTIRGQWVDERSLEGAFESTWGFYQRAKAEISLDVLPLAVGILGAAGVLISAVVRREVVVPLIAVAGGAAAMLGTQVLKYQILSRPDLDVSAANMNSFPSGHSTAAAAAVLALVLAAPRVARPWLAVVGSVMAGVAGAGTLIMTWHRPSDIVGAFLVVALCGTLAGWAVARRERTLATAHLAKGLAPRRMDARPGRLARGASLAVALLGLATVAICAVLLVPQLQSPGTEGAPSVTWFLTVGLALSVSTACAVFTLLERWVDSFPRAAARSAPRAS